MSELIEDVILTENCLRKARERGITIRQVFEAITYGRPWVTELGGLSFYHNGIEVITCASFEYAITVIDHGQDLTHELASVDMDVSPPLRITHDVVEPLSYMLT
ncbi:hypothetical protein A9Q84_01715 [Halobacteriovorax marinus]|uniref:DUF4258 domain-containing protein n=1 Tax=Halobacteriovorax marinus TaxID=97084 RepID=A0A1Y5FCF7_9BACT|nr:hypothetical protein A9Q84_01715 [Halobacteriovorax marinus]